MKVLVTGGAGFIGSHLADRLLDAGSEVTVLDNLSTGKRGNLSLFAPGLEFVEGDVRDPDTVRQCVRGVDAVVHLAAVASVQASIDDPVATHQTNFDGTLNLLEASRAAGVKRFLYASSAAVYGDTRQLPVTEQSGLQPLSPYAADKLAGEHYLYYYFTKHALAGTAFRFFNIYGPRQDPSSPYSGVISIFVDRIKAGSPVTIFGDGQQTRDFVFVGDLVGLLTRALDDSRLAGTTVNVGTGKECSLLQLLDALESLAGRKIPRTHGAARVGDIVRSCADVTRLRNCFGSIPSTPIREGLRTLVPTPAS
ncbi:MAG: NAD-dependent epimerase/dehydratase family protein [Acidiferrobacterales bacterium]